MYSIVELNILPNKNLQIKLVKGCKAELKEICNNDRIGIFDKLFEVLEYHLCNGWEWLQPEEVGALTDAPILTYDCLRDENTDEILTVGDVWWYPEYMIHDPIKILFEEGEVIFTREDNS